MDFRLDEHPLVTAERKRLVEVMADLQGNEADIRAAIANLCRPVDSERQEEVENYLAGKPAATLDMTAARETLADVQNRHGFLKIAAERQREKLRQARVAASIEICREHGPAWLAKAKKIRDHAAGLAKLGEEQRAFFNDLERQGVTVTEPISFQCSMSESLLWQLQTLVEEIDKAT